MGVPTWTICWWVSSSMCDNCWQHKNYWSTTRHRWPSSLPPSSSSQFNMLKCIYCIEFSQVWLGHIHSIDRFLLPLWHSKYLYQIFSLLHGFAWMDSPPPHPPIHQHPFHRGPLNCERTAVLSDTQPGQEQSLNARIEWHILTGFVFHHHHPHAHHDHHDQYPQVDK